MFAAIKGHGHIVQYLVDECKAHVGVKDKVLQFTFAFNVNN